MSENEKTVETAAPACRKSSDARTFCIALLTAIVVVAAYHVGTRVCRMFCRGPRACGQPAVTYMLIPVVNAPAGPMAGPHGPGFRHGRRMGAPEGMPHKGGFRPGKGPGFRKGPAPADKPADKPAEKAPAAKQDAVTGATAKPAAK